MKYLTTVKIRAFSMKTPSITVLMPVYNGEKYLRLAIDSILNQTYSDFEFLIINDGSTDKSEEIILSYHDDRIRYVKNEINQKLIKTLNKGIDLAKGEYIARMDCDDISFPHRFKTQLQYMMSHPDIDGVCGKAVDLLPNNEIKRSLRYLRLHKDAFRFTSLIEISFCHPCLMIKSAILKKHYFLDTDAALHIEDMELGSRLSILGFNIEVLDEFLIYYRKNPTGICFTHRDEQETRSYELAKTNLFNSLNYNLDKNFYLLLTNKNGFDKLYKLNYARCELCHLVDLYFSSNASINSESKKDIKLWARVREFSFLISALHEIHNLKSKTIVITTLLANFRLMFDIDFLKLLLLWIQDWSCFAYKRTLK